MNSFCDNQAVYILANHKFWILPPSLLFTMIEAKRRSHSNDKEAAHKYLFIIVAYYTYVQDWTEILFN